MSARSAEGNRNPRDRRNFSQFTESSTKLVNKPFEAIELLALSASVDDRNALRSFQTSRRASLQGLLS